MNWNTFYEYGDSIVMIPAIAFFGRRRVRFRISFPALFALGIFTFDRLARNHSSVVLQILNQAQPNSQKTTSFFV